MNRNTRRLFSELPLQFNMRLEREEWELWIGPKDAVEASTHLNLFPGMRTKVGPGDSLVIQYTTPALYSTQFSREDAFANTLLHAVDDPEHYGLCLADGSAVPKDMLEELNSIAARFALVLEWREHQFVMIDNSRFMHSRVAYSDEARDVKFLCTRRYRSPEPL